MQSGSFHIQETVYKQKYERYIGDTILSTFISDMFFIVEKEMETDAKVREQRLRAISASFVRIFLYSKVSKDFLFALEI